MKRLMRLVICMAFVLGTTSVFAQSNPPKQKTQKKAPKKKASKKKSGDDTKKDAGK